MMSVSSYGVPLEPRASILVVDDHPVLRRGITQLLNAEHDIVVCAEADSPAAALAAIAARVPDLVLLDLVLASGSGFGLIKDIRGRYPDLPVLVLSMHDETLYAERVLRAGASGYIMKQEATEHIFDAIRQVLRGQVYLSEAMAARLLHRIVGRARQGDESSLLSKLSDRELEIFQLLGHGLPLARVAEQLGLSVKTVETHVDHLKTKLGLETSRELRWLAARRSVDPS